MTKTRIHILAALLCLLAAAGLPSCTKETPEPLPEVRTDNPDGKKDDPEPTPKQATPGLALAEGSAFAYVGIPVTVAFETVGEPCEGMEVTFASDGKSSVTGSFDPATGKGEVSVTLGPGAERSKSHVTLSAAGGEGTTECTLDVTAYYLDITAGDLSLPGGAGEKAPLSYKADTNIPEFAPAVSVDADWLSFSEGMIITLSENRTGAERTATVSLSDADSRFGPFTLTAIQETLPPKAAEGSVAFAEWPFKEACLEAADRNGDGEVSPDEALSVTELVIPGRGIHDLAGLEAFRNIWKLDARDNDIEDADVLRELRRLHWLDLRGNRGLRTFDLTGCSIYFDHCLFEATDELEYRVLSRQVGVAGGGEWSTNSDPWCEHSVHVRDERQTSDWSHQNRLVKLQDRSGTVTRDGREMEYSICLTGIGYIDADLEDGSYDRLMRDAAGLLRTRFPELAARWDCFDVYYMERVTENRHKWMECPMGSDWTNDPKARSMKEGFNAENRDLLTDAYDAIAGENPDGTRKVFIVELNLHPAPHQQGIPCDCLLGTCYPYESKSLDPRLQNAYLQRFTFAPYVDNFADEQAFVLDQTPTSLIDERIDKVVDYFVEELF